jgi:RNA polymerase subunit RPABC4/transcription elongation factor Spt4
MNDLRICRYCGAPLDDEDSKICRICAEDDYYDYAGITRDEAKAMREER